MWRRPLTETLLAVGAVLTLAGCAAYMEPEDPTYPDDWVIDGPAAPGPAEVVGPDLGPGPVPGFDAVPGPWVCTYEPMMDGDWHDDVVCSNGVEEHQPYLLEWDPFATEDEIWDAALEYEEYLNLTYPSGDG